MFFNFESITQTDANQTETNQTEVERINIGKILLRKMTLQYKVSSNDYNLLPKNYR